MPLLKGFWLMKNILVLILIVASWVFASDREWVNVELQLLYSEGELSESELYYYHELTDDMKQNCEELSELIISLDCTDDKPFSNKVKSSWKGEDKGPQFKSLNWEASWGSTNNKLKLENKKSKWIVSDYRSLLRSQILEIELGKLSQDHEIIHWKKRNAKTLNTDSISESWVLEPSTYGGGRIKIWQSPSKQNKVTLESVLYNQFDESKNAKELHSKTLWQFEHLINDVGFVRLGLDGIWQKNELWNFLEIKMLAHSVGVWATNPEKYYSYWQYKPKSKSKASNGKFTLKLGKGVHDWMWVEKLGGEELDSLFWMRFKGWTSQQIGGFKISNKAQLWTSEDSTWFKLDNINSYRLGDFMTRSYLEQNNENPMPKVSGAGEWFWKNLLEKWKLGAKFVIRPFESKSEWSNAHKFWIKRKSKTYSLELGAKFCRVVSQCEGVLLSQKTRLNLLSNGHLKAQIHTKGIWVNSDFVEPVVYLGVEWNAIQ
jgi:hypothetical protein